MINKKLVMILFVFLVVKSMGQFFDRGKFTVEVFDVGQGDAILITTPENLKILIDGGPDYEVDRYLDKKFLLNSCHVDILVLTHPHQDHIKGLNRVLDRCKVDLVVHYEVDYDLREYKLWYENLKKVEVRPARSGDVIELGRQFGSGKIKLVVVWPDEPGKHSDNINNASVSVLLDVGDFEALFLGDLEKEASSKIDRNLLSKYIDGPLEVYKVPHHGSIDSNNPKLAEFIEPVKCLVSVGEDNKFNHPNQETIDTLGNLGCEVLRTDQVGSIEVLIN